MDNEQWNLNTAKTIKVIKVLLYEKDGTSIIDYFCSITDVKFTTRASEMRYGETHYYRGDGTNIKIMIVPTITLSAVPRRYRKHHWFYVFICCHPDDTKFDVFSGFDVVDANQYRI